jgi:hypothetical protein
MNMSIKKIDEMDYYFKNIADTLKDELKCKPVLLTPVAEYLNWISFDKRNSIGINLEFEDETRDEIIEALAMSVGCDALDFNDDPQDLDRSNMFGNEEKFTLYLKDNIDNKDPVEELIFDITLYPSGKNNNVLHLTNLIPGGELRIIGNPKLVLDWPEAQVKTQKILEFSVQEGDELFKGEFPKTEHIDLSISDDYNGHFDGFEFMQEHIKASVYLSGPDKMIQSIISTFQPTLSLTAQYDRKPLSIIPLKLIELDAKRVDIANNKDYTYKDKNENIIYRRAELPHTSLENFNFVDILNTRPADLFFKYEVKLPPKINVKPEMFKDDNDKVDPEITVTLILLIHLELKARPGAWIKYSDMFNGQTDLFGRRDPKEYSVFNLLDEGSIKFAVNFADAFFTGGNLFIEKKPMLFREGIPVNGKTIVIDILKDDYDFIKENLIDPDFKLEFKEGGKITIPRNIGVTSITIKAKGRGDIPLDKIPFNLDF